MGQKVEENFLLKDVIDRQKQDQDKLKKKIEMLEDQLDNKDIQL